MHLNCKKQEFAIGKILASKSQLIDLNILAALIKIVEVLQQMAFFFLFVVLLTQKKKTLYTGGGKKKKSHLTSVNLL